MKKAIKSFGWTAVALVLLFFTLRGMQVTLADFSQSGISTVTELLFVAATLSVGCIVLHLQQVRTDVRRSIKTLYLGMFAGFFAPIIAYVYSVDASFAHDAASGLTYVCIAAFFINFLMFGFAREWLKDEEANPMAT